ncbi:MAG: cation:dicarboxylase symporter family transporter [Alphaproteobacteria bacterium]|jgi:Na+/H+-dicarboxylate symporter|nr:cation:dicarboxylase symporter family transporter [Alphaproteobacteria bacterium]MBP9777469.1 cation:dicarboxylase symporter family transporter [Alphaproteobacteria bacterium]
MKEFGLIIKLAISMAFIMLFGDWIPEEVQRAFFTISVLMKETLVFCMPFIVFSFIFACLSAFQKRAPLLILLILSLVVLSNFIFVQIGFFAGDIFLPALGYTPSSAVKIIGSQLPSLEPFFTIPYPQLISIDKALLLGTILGLFGAFFGNEKLAQYGNSLKDAVQAGLTKIFIPLVPVYIIGFLLKIHHDDSLVEMFTGYGPMIVLIVVIQFMATLLFYIKVNLGNIKDIKTSLKNVFPSSIVALSTMSSMATLPLTLEAAEKNTKNMAVAQIMIPATVNIHHVGDSIAVPILIAVVLAMHGIPPMSYETFFVFSLYYMVAKFGVPSVPGGELIVLFPILEGQYGFTDSMSGLLTTLYLLMDPFITTTNVLANGALAICMDKICGRMKAFQATEATLS